MKSHASVAPSSFERPGRSGQFRAFASESSYGRRVAGPPTEIELRPPGPARGQALAPRLFLLLFVASIGSVFYLFLPYATDLILALLLVALGWSPYRRLSTALGHRRWLASSLMTSLILVLIALPAGFIATSLSREAATLYDNTQATLSLDTIETFIMGDSWAASKAREAAALFGLKLDRETLAQTFTSSASTIAAFVYLQVNALLSNLVSGLFHFAIIIVMVFYLFVDGLRLKQWLFRISPLPVEQEEIIAQKFSAVGRATLFGNGIGSVMQGCLGGLAMWLVGLPSPVLWGTIMSIFAFLPVVGISVVVIPATAYLLVAGNTLAAIFFFGFCGVQALFMENVVKTRLIGRNMQMHDLVIFMSILGGLTAFGVLGILYGPLIVALFITMCELFEADYKDRLIRVRRTRSAIHSHSMVAGGLDETS